MKICSTCGEEKSFAEFSKNKAKKDNLQVSCKKCCNKRHRDYYAKNNERQRKQINKARKIRLVQNKRIMFEFLMNNPCTDCGETDPRVLEFDHQRDKTKNVSSMLNQGYSQKKIKEEIDKCLVRCANCHRRKTAIDQEWYSHKLFLENIQKRNKNVS